MQTILFNIDISVFFYFQSVFHNFIMDIIMIFMTKLGDNGFIWITIAALLMINRRTRKTGTVLLAALLFNAIAGDVILKNAIQRPRPFLEFPNIKLLIEEPKSFSFPSGHTASSFVSAYVLSNSFRKYTAIFFILAFLIAFSRIYLGVHYLSDILGGVILGLLCGIITVKIFRKDISKNNY